MVFVSGLLQVRCDPCWWEGTTASGMGCLLVGRDTCEWEGTPACGLGRLPVGCDAFGLDFILSAGFSGVLAIIRVKLMFLAFTLTIM